MSLNVTNIGSSCSPFDIQIPQSMASFYNFISDSYNNQRYFLVRNTSAVYSGTGLNPNPPFFLIPQQVNVTGDVKSIENLMKFRLLWESNVTSTTTDNAGVVSAAGTYLPSNLSLQDARTTSNKRFLVAGTTADNGVTFTDSSRSATSPAYPIVYAQFDGGKISVTLEIPANASVVLGNQIPASSVTSFGGNTPIRLIFRPTNETLQATSIGNVFYWLLNETDWNNAGNTVDDNSKRRVLNSLTMNEDDLLDPAFSASNDVYLSIWRVDSVTISNFGTPSTTHNVKGFRLTTDGNAPPAGASPIRTLQLSGQPQAAQAPAPTGALTFVIGSSRYIGIPTTQGSSRFNDRNGDDFARESRVFLLKDSTAGSNRYLKFVISSTTLSPTADSTAQQTVYNSLKPGITGGTSTTKGFTSPTMSNNFIRKAEPFTRSATNVDLLYFANTTHINSVYLSNSQPAGSLTSISTVGTAAGTTFMDFIVSNNGNHLYILYRPTATTYTLARRTITADNAIPGANAFTGSTITETKTYRSIAGVFGASNGNVNKIYLAFSDATGAVSFYTFVDILDPSAAAEYQATGAGFKTGSLKFDLTGGPTDGFPMTVWSSPSHNVLVHKTNGNRLVSVNPTSYEQNGSATFASVGGSNTTATTSPGPISSISFNRSGNTVFGVTTDGIFFRAVYDQNDPFGSFGDQDIFTLTSFGLAAGFTPVYVDANTTDNTFFMTLFGSSQPTSSVTKLNPDGSPYMGINVLATGNFMIPYLGSYWDENVPSDVYQFRAYRITPTKFAWQRGVTATTTGTTFPSASQSYPFLYSESFKNPPELLPVVSGLTLSPDLSEPPILFELETAGGDVKVKDGYGNYLSRYNPDLNAAYQFLGFVKDAEPSSHALFKCVFCTASSGVTTTAGAASVCQVTASQPLSVVDTSGSVSSGGGASVLDLTTAQKANLTHWFRADDQNTGTIGGQLTTKVGTVTVVNPTQGGSPMTVSAVSATNPNKFIEIDGQTGRRLDFTGPATPNGFTMMIVLNNMTVKPSGISQVFGSQVWESGAYHTLFLQTASTLTVASNGGALQDRNTNSGLIEQSTFVLTVTITSGGVITVYKNKTSQALSSSTPGSAPNFNGKQMNIGAWFDGSGSTRTLTGKIGEFLLYTRVLTQTDINDIYNNYLRQRFTSLPA